VTTRRRSAAALAVTVALAAGCASAPTRAAADPGRPLPPLPSLASSVTPAGTDWATLPMGAASGPNQFWQLFTRTAGGHSWTLRTPPAIATNGALVLAVRDARTLVTGIRPSLDLAFSPITVTTSGGGSWSTVPPNPGLANLPDALAAAPSGQLIAVDRDQQVDTAGTSGSWARLTSQKALATVHGCALTTLTGAAFSPDGAPLLAGTCGRTGAAGILRYAGGTWQLASLALPAALAGQPIQVIRLTRTTDGDVALLEAGRMGSVRLAAAWTGDNGEHWMFSPVASLGSAYVVVASFGASGSAAAVLSDGRGQTVSGRGAAWQALPSLPAGRAVVLTLPAGGGTEALTASGSTLAAWQLTGRPTRWTRTQSIVVPIQYGSSSAGNEPS